MMDPSTGPAGAWMIRPGQGIGKVGLGDNFPDVVKRIGEPSHNPGDGDAAMGHIWLVWRGAKGGELDVYTVRGADDSASNPQAFVRQIRVTSTSFHTSRDLRVGMPLAEVAKRDRAAKRVHLSSTACVYDDERSGIAFEFRRSAEKGDWRCFAITVHPRRSPVDRAYLPFDG